MVAAEFALAAGFAGLELAIAAPDFCGPSALM
jgi:hypothetical protein